MARADYQAQEEFTWQPYRVKPLAVWAMRINRDFECRSLEGTLHGKTGDWLVRGEDGWTYPVPDAVFRRYYVKREWRRPHEGTQEEGNAQRTETRQVHAGHEQGPR